MDAINAAALLHLTSSTSNNTQALYFE